LNSDLSELKPHHRSRLLIIRELITGYDGTIPFHLYLKNNFSKNKRFGSYDRRIYRSWCYAWFRLGKTLNDISFFERLVLAYFLVHGLDDDFSSAIAKELFGINLAPNTNLLLDSRIEKVQQLTGSFHLNQIFTFDEELSNGISNRELSLSMLTQPKVFIRILEAYVDIVKKECLQNSISFETIEGIPGCLAFESAVKLESLPSREKGFFEIQDLSSQLAGHAIPAKENEAWWDCCCGAGGKSLLLLEKVKGIKLTATDKRESVLLNFSERLKKTGRHKVESGVFDFTNPFPEFVSGKQFNGIIADVPCSGSGTWGRTPEKLAFFNKSEIAGFAEMQKNIVTKALSCLAPGGKFIYITCSVFKEENEEIAAFIASSNSMQIIENKLINGTSNRSDSMYYAIFQKA